MAILNDCLLPLISGLVLANSRGGGGNVRSAGFGGGGGGGGGPVRELITLPVSVPLPPLPPPGDLRSELVLDFSDLSLFLWLPPEALLPIITQKHTSLAT